MGDISTYGAGRYARDYRTLKADYVRVGGTGSDSPTAEIMGGGTNLDPVLSDSEANNFIDFRLKSRAAAGDLRGMYLRHEISGGANGEAGRFVCRVSSTSGADSNHGMHNTLSIAAAGKITGLGVGVRATLETDDNTDSGGTLAALQVDSNIGTGTTVPAATSLIRLAKAGAVDIPFFLDVSDDQCLKGSAATGSATDALVVRMPNGTTLYLSLIAAS